MPTTTAPKAAPKAAPKIVLPETEAVEQLTGQLNQAAAENEALAQRNKQLAGFQAEVQEARQTIVNLIAEVSSLTQERDTAVRVAAAARNEATNATASKGSDADKLAHAEALVAAIKGLSK